MWKKLKRLNVETLNGWKVENVGIYFSQNGIYERLHSWNLTSIKVFLLLQFFHWLLGLFTTVCPKYLRSSYTQNFVTLVIISALLLYSMPCVAGYHVFTSFYSLYPFYSVCQVRCSSSMSFFYTPFQVSLFTMSTSLLLQTVLYALLTYLLLLTALLPIIIPGVGARSSLLCFVLYMFGDFVLSLEHVSLLSMSGHSAGPELNNFIKQLINQIKSTEVQLKGPIKFRKFIEFLVTWHRWGPTCHDRERNL